MTWMNIWLIQMYMVNPADEIMVIELRIPDSYHAKTLKNHTPLVRYASYFYKKYSNNQAKCDRGV